MSLNQKFSRLTKFYSYQIIIIYCAVHFTFAFIEFNWLKMAFTLPIVIIGCELIRRDLIYVEISLDDTKK